MENSCKNLFAVNYVEFKFSANIFTRFVYFEYNLSSAHLLFITRIERICEILNHTRDKVQDSK